MSKSNLRSKQANIDNLLPNWCFFNALSLLFMRQFLCRSSMLAAHPPIWGTFYSYEHITKSLQEPNNVLFPAEITSLPALLISHQSSITGKKLPGPHITALLPLIPLPFSAPPSPPPSPFLSGVALINGDRWASPRGTGPIRPEGWLRIYVEATERWTRGGSTLYDPVLGAKRKLSLVGGPLRGGDGFKREEGGSTNRKYDVMVTLKQQLMVTSNS